MAATWTRFWGTRRLPVADTNVLVALLDRDHPHHGRAASDLSGHERVLLPTVVLAELTTYLRRTAKDAGLDGNRIARDAVHELLGAAGVHHATSFDADRALRLFARRGRLSLADAVVIATATRHSEGLVCYDRAMQAAFRSES